MDRSPNGQINLDFSDKRHSPELNKKLSEQRKQNGMQQALDSASRKDPAWEQKSFEFLTSYVKAREANETFRCEEIRIAAEKVLLMPPSPHAWGMLMRRAMISGIVKKVGLDKVENPKAHRGIVNLYVKNI